MHVDSIAVKECLEALIPNVITPDGDAFNEYLVIDALDLTKRNTLIIFNRWGKQVYSSYDYQNNWNAHGLPAGTYFYQLANALDRKLYKGWVQVIK
jgi:gliding motility-associated-like protein